MQLISAAILGIVEGVTEFLPVSSTGHLIVAANWLNFNGQSASTFEIFIQLGAILAVLLIYKNTFLNLFAFNNSEEFTGLKGLELLILTTLPALFFGALAHGFIKKNLFGPVTVAAGLGLGGVAILLVERFLPATKKSNLNDITRTDALTIGFFQCLALWPGMSRSACTIIGSLIIGIGRKTAVEYSFLAAVPVLFAAIIFDLYKSFSSLSSADLVPFAVGFMFAFGSAWLAIRFFIGMIGTHTLKAFGWYRILAAIVLALAFY